MTIWIDEGDDEDDNDNDDDDNSNDKVDNDDDDEDDVGDYDKELNISCFKLMHILVVMIQS